MNEPKVIGRGLELRDRMAKAYLDGYRRAGVASSYEDAQKQAVADLVLVDNATNAGDIGKPVSKPTSKPRVKRNELVKAQEETGLNLGQRTTAYRPSVLYQNPQEMSERFGAACARIARILQGTAKSSSIVGAVESAEHGALALEYAELWSNYQTRTKPAPTTGKDHNPFRGMSDRDASRMFMRGVEDIADKSTGVLGSWYVK